MANDLSNIRTTAYQRYYQRIGAGINDWNRVADVISPDVASLQRSDMYGLTAYASQVASPTANDLSTGKSTTASVAYEKYAILTEKAVADNPEAPAELAGKFADVALWTIANLFWTAFTGANALTHPENGGNYTATGGGTVYFADSFATPVSQANLMTTALSASALASAKQILREYKNKAGIPHVMDLQNSNLVLVVPAALEDTAVNLSARRGEIYDGSGLQSGAYTGVGVVVTPAEYDADDWWLVARSMSPFKVWLRKMPTLRVTLAEDSGHYKFYGSFIAAIVLEPNEAGFVMSAV